MKEIDIGNVVICDMCNTDYSESDEQGGLIYRTHAVCPRCAPGWEIITKTPNLARRPIDQIKARCPSGLSFRDWILKLRGGDNKIRIYP